MKRDKDLRFWIGSALACVCLVGVIVCAILAFIFNIQHPDMTEMRLLMENPGPAIGAVVFASVLPLASYITRDK